LRQGHEIAALPFIIVSEIAVRRSKVGTRGTMFDKCSQITVYADYVVIMGRMSQHSKEVFISPVKQTSKMGSEINEKYKIYYSITVSLTTKMNM
jgi:hypothetical protein